MYTSVILQPVTDKEKMIFLEMAQRYFTELNPRFVPDDDWKANYFETILSNPNMFLRWIIADGERTGFILYGIEHHRFLPRTVGVIYELYVQPNYRKRGLAMACAKQAIKELQNCGVAKIQIEIMVNNDKAKELWKKLGFVKVSERYVLGG